MKELINVFKALSDETRIRIMKVLLEKDNVCVCQVMEALNISQTRASRNLKILKEAGLINDKREGIWIHYTVNKGKRGCCTEAVNALMKKSLNDVEVIKKDRERLKKTKKKHDRHR